MKLWKDQRNAHVFNYLTVHFCLTCFGLSLAHHQRQVYNFGSSSTHLSMVSAPGRWPILRWVEPLEYWVVLVDRILIIPYLLITTDVYCIFSMVCNFWNKIATTNLSVVLCWLGFCVCASGVAIYDWILIDRSWAFSSALSEKYFELLTCIRQPTSASNMVYTVHELCNWYSVF
jgi:hypothetical protein